jgi:hypothetical protein
MLMSDDTESGSLCRKTSWFSFLSLVPCWIASCHSQTMVILSAVFRSVVSQLIDVTRDICTQQHFASRGTMDVNTSMCVCVCVCVCEASSNLTSYGLLWVTSDVAATVSWRYNDLILCGGHKLPPRNSRIDSRGYSHNVCCETRVITKKGAMYRPEFSICSFLWTSTCTPKQSSQIYWNLIQATSI